jgi:hypothetical protein
MISIQGKNVWSNIQNIYFKGHVLIKSSICANKWEKILKMSYTEWEGMEYSKGTLHQLKKMVRSDKVFNLYEKVIKFRRSESPVH